MPFLSSRGHSPLLSPSTPAIAGDMVISQSNTIYLHLADKLGLAPTDAALKLWDNQVNSTQSDGSALWMSCLRGPDLKTLDSARGN